MNANTTLCSKKNVKYNFQGTYLDTILPRADIPQNQVSEHKFFNYTQAFKG